MCPMASSDENEESESQTSPSTKRKEFNVVMEQKQKIYKNMLCVLCNSVSKSDKHKKLIYYA